MTGRIFINSHTDTNIQRENDDNVMAAADLALGVNDYCCGQLLWFRTIRQRSGHDSEHVRTWNDDDERWGDLVKAYIRLPYE